MHREEHSGTCVQTSKLPWWWLRTLSKAAYNRRQGRQSGFKTGRVVGPGLKTGGVVCPKHSTGGGTLHRFEGVILGFFYLIIIIYRSVYLCRQFTTLESVVISYSLYTLGYHNI